MKFRPLKYVFQEVLPSYGKEGNLQCCFCSGVTVLILMTECAFLLYIFASSRILTSLITLLCVLGQVGEIWTSFLVH
jgi:hypothetical protein